MSLKAFHLVFIVASVLLSIGVATWGLLNYFSAHGKRPDLVWGLAGLAAAAGLLLYERYFLKKFKDVSYL